MADRGAHDSSVCHHRAGRRIFPCQRVEHCNTPRLQHRRRFTAGRYEVRHVGSPRIECFARDFVPGFSFPFPEVHFHQSRVEARRWVQQGGEFPAACERAGDHWQSGRQLRTQGVRRADKVKCGNIELSVADAFGDLRTRVANQENLHSRPM